jgi:hypothetical protein
MTVADRDFAWHYLLTTYYQTVGITVLLIIGVILLRRTRKK